MANTKIIIAGTTVTMCSAHSMDELNKVAMYKPEAMSLSDEAGFPYFSVMPGVRGDVKESGIAYSATAPDGSGKAVVSIGLPVIDGMDAKAAVAAKYGPIIANANKVEAQIDAALDEVNTMLASVEAQIVVASE